MTFNYLQRKLSKHPFLIKPLLVLLSYFIKKDARQWGFLINSSQGLEGNLRALFDYAYRHPQLRPFIVDARNEDNTWITKEYPDTYIVPYNLFSLEAIKWRLSCGAYILSHGHKYLGKEFSSLRNTRIVNVWHGIPLKGMGNLDSKTREPERRQLVVERNITDIFCVSSETEKSQIAGCLFLSGDRIKVTGIPRNDWLLCEEDLLPKDLREAQRNLSSQLGSRRLVLYAPTFRDYNRKARGFDPDNFKPIAALLSKHNAIMGIRAHPKDKDLFSDIVQNFENVMDLSYANIQETTILLRETDILISDYSSIWVDYLLLKRPIIGYVFDYTLYKSSRGLMYNYESIFPGELCESTEDLAKLLDSTLDQPPFNLIKSHWVKSLLHANDKPEFCANVEYEILALENK